MFFFNNSENKSLTGNTKTCLNWSQTDERRKQGYHEKVESDLWKQDENLK